MTDSSCLRFVSSAALGAVLMFISGCGSSNSNNNVGTDTTAGVVLGPLDNHCTGIDGGLTIQTVGVCEVTDPGSVPTDTSICTPVTFATDTDTGSSDVDAGSDAAAPTSDYGATMYGAAGNDDDCKYYVSWVATPIKENADTYFTVTALRLEDMQPARCAGIRADTSLSISHGAPPPAQPAPEIAPGVYKVGPIVFDAPGVWTERFHLFEECSDDPDDSPHGHAAFFIKVP